MDTLERVARYLGAEQSFLSAVRDAKDRTFQMTMELEHDRDEGDLRDWIRDEISRQLANRQKNHTGDDDSSVPVAAYHGEHADRVRDFVVESYVEPARSEGLQSIRVRAGDIDKALGFRYRRLPLVCSALRSRKFEEQASVRLVGEDGPPSGASTNTTFTFELEP